ncbi:MAG: cryptochrome/photolyase family protein, partial [Aquisalinus sp.]|nr:cryptochrome/photolyase family protein [Aquisalinus sp.]
VVYADAYEWVELPNTHGMAIYADGGVMASKPYAASGSYINRMSNYCKSCTYNVSRKTGDDACPFNYLYWNFIENNRDKLEGNGRMGLVFKNLDKKSDEERRMIKKSARKFLDTIS